MNSITFSIIALVLAYLIGSFPSAFIIAKLRRGMDIRQVGSRNMGAMNVFYKVGFWWGMLTLALDIGKGMLGVGIAIWMGAHFFAQLAAGVMVIVGHNLPVFLKFKGGKGGASCIGILVILMPWGFLIYLALFGLILLITRFPTLSYSLAFICFPIMGAFLYNSPIYHPPAYIIYPIVLILLPFLRYIPRIREMRRGSGGGGWKHVVMRKNLKDRL